MWTSLLLCLITGWFGQWNVLVPPINAIDMLTSAVWMHHNLVAGDDEQASNAAFVVLMNVNSRNYFPLLLPKIWARDWSKAKSERNRLIRSRMYFAYVDRWLTERIRREMNFNWNRKKKTIEPSTKRFIMHYTTKNIIEN